MRWVAAASPHTSVARSGQFPKTCFVFLPHTLQRHHHHHSDRQQAGLSPSSSSSLLLLCSLSCVSCSAFSTPPCTRWLPKTKTTTKQRHERVRGCEADTLCTWGPHKTRKEQRGTRQAQRLSRAYTHSQPNHIHAHTRVLAACCGVAVNTYSFFEPNTRKMEPLCGTIVIVASHHASVCHLPAHAIQWLVGVNGCFFGQYQFRLRLAQQFLVLHRHRQCSVQANTRANTLSPHTTHLAHSITLPGTMAALLGGLHTVSFATRERVCVGTVVTQDKQVQQSVHVPWETPRHVLCARCLQTA